MMAWPSWLWVGTPLKFFLWLGNRCVTWIGSLVLWRRWRDRRRVWLRLWCINLLSLGGLGLIFFWLHIRAAHSHALPRNDRPHPAVVRQ